MQSSYSNNLCFTYPSIAPNPTTCQAAGHTSCCSASGNGCYVSGGGCWCDEVCRNYGNCCPDIDTTCPKRKWPTQSSVISEYILNNETINNTITFLLLWQKQHVKLPDTIPAALEVAVMCLLADAGVIITAIELATAAPISAQPVQEVSHMRPIQLSWGCLQLKHTQ